MLTEPEMGAEQWEKAKTDRARFRGIPGQAREYAASRGEQAAWRMRIIARSDVDGGVKPVMEREAVMFAQQAFRGWRAYRIMKG